MFSKKWMLSFGLAVVLSSTAMAQGDSDRQLGITLDATIASKYMWRGFDVLDDHAAFQPSADFDLWQTGLGANVWGSFALSGGFEDLDELDYTLYYSRTLFEEESYAIDFGMNFIYYDFPNTGSELADSMEAGISLALPSLIPLGDSFLVPFYYGGYLWPYDEDEGPDEGWYHNFGLACDLPITPLISEQEEQAISLSADVSYTDGYFDVEPGFTHATVSISTTFESKGFSVTPAVYYQNTFDEDDGVNTDEDEVWTTLSVSYAFSAF